MGMFSPQQKLGSEYALGELKETVTRLENMLKGQADLLQEVKERLQRIEELLAHGTASTAPTAAPITPAQLAVPVDPVELYNKGLEFAESAADFAGRFQAIEITTSDVATLGVFTRTEVASNVKLKRASSGSMLVAATDSGFQVFPVFGAGPDFEQELMDCFTIEREPAGGDVGRFILRVREPARAREIETGWVLEAKGRIIVASR
jgi:hypothetical protein